MSEQISEKLNYSKVDYTHPSYRMNRILQQAGSQTVTVTTAGGQESLFELPINAFNLPRSEISYTFNLPEVNGKYIHTFKDVQSHIRQIQLYSRSGTYLCDLNNASRCNKIMGKTDTELQDYLTYDTQQSAATEATSSGVSRQLQRAVPQGVEVTELFLNGIDAGVKVVSVAATGVFTFNTGQPDMRTLFRVGDFMQISAAAENGGMVTAVGIASVTLAAPVLVSADAVITSCKRTRFNVDSSNQRRYDGTVLNLQNTESQYIESGVLGAGAEEGALFGKVKIPLGAYKNTILSLDKDLYAGEILILRIVWNASTSIYYSGDSGTDPALVPVAAVGSMAISNLQLFLATEQNRAIVNKLKSQVQSGGMSMLIPYVHSYKTNLAGTSQSVSLRFNRGHGIRLQKIYHSIFNNTENINTAYDNGNISDAKCSSFYTMLNNSRLQEFDVDTSNYEDFMLLKDKIKSSVLQNSNIYHYNWCWIDDFTENKDPDERSMDLSYENKTDGLDLSLEQKWDIYATVANANYNHYSFAVVQKMLTVGPSGITVL